MITKRLSATGLTRIGPNHDRYAACWILLVSGTFSGTLKLRKCPIDSSVTDANAPLTDFEDFADYTVVDKATGATAAGIYKVLTDGCRLILDYTHSSGEMVVELEPVIG